MTNTKNERDAIRTVGRPKASTRIAVFRRDGWLCVYCRSTGPLAIDHVVPTADGGTHDATNLVTACKDCNDTKAAWPIDLFAELLERRGVDTAENILQRVYRAITQDE